MSMKYGVPAIIAGAVLLAALVIQRLDDQALALLTGVVCGVAAGIPMTALLFWLHQRQQRAQAAQQAEPPPPQPPYIVLQQPPPASPPWPQGYPPLPSQTRAPRDFNIVGDEEEPHGHS